MTNNKQQTAVDWLAVRRDVLEIEVRLGKLSPIEYAEELTKAEQQAKEMEKEQHVQIWNDSLEEVLKKLESLKQYYNSNQRRR